MPKNYANPRQLAIDFDAPPPRPKPPPKPRPILSHAAVQAQIRRNVKALEAKLRAPARKVRNQFMVRDLYGGVVGWRIDAMLHYVPDLRIVARFPVSPSVVAQWDAMRAQDVPHGSVALYRDFRTDEVVLLADGMAEGHYQDLPLYA